MLCRMKEKKIYQSIILILGIVSIIVGVVMAAKLPEDAHNLVRFAGMLTGFGSGIAAVAIVFFVRDKITPEEKKREREIKRNDERNIQITRAAYAVVVSVTFVLEAVMSFVFLLLNDYTTSAVMIVAIYIEVITFAIAYRVLNKKM